MAVQRTQTRGFQRKERSTPPATVAATIVADEKMAGKRLIWAEKRRVLNSAGEFALT